MQSLLQCDLKLLTSPFHIVFFLLLEDSHSRQKWNKVKCVRGRVHMEALTSAGVKQPFFQQSSHCSVNTLRLKDCFFLSKNARKKWPLSKQETCLLKVRLIALVMINSVVDNAQLMNYLLSKSQYHKRLPFSSQSTHQGLLDPWGRKEDKTHNEKKGLVN